MILVSVLLAALALCLVFSWTTRGAMTDLAFLRAHRGASAQSLVDLHPWQTAQTLAATSEEAEAAAGIVHRKPCADSALRWMEAPGAGFSILSAAEYAESID